eukprot:10753546-Lingulodinium_polyedra.AAC.1
MHPSSTQACSRMRSNGPFAATAGRKSHARVPCARAFAWGACACDLRATAAADGRLDRIIVH